MFPQQTPPSSKEAEERLLGCLLVGGSYVEEAVGTITSEMFYHAGHAAIMKAIAEVHASNTIVDITTVTNAMRRKGADPTIGIKLMELTEPIVSDINAPSYAQIVIQKYINREAIRRAAELQEAAYSDDLDEVIAQSSELSDALLNNIPAVNAEDIKSVLSANIKEMDQRNAARGKTQYIDCRIHAIDAVIGGFDPGSLVVIAGRPSMGKSAMALQLAYNISSFFPVLFFTLEMTKAEIGNRYLTMLTDIDTIRLKRGDNFTADEWRLLDKATAEMEQRTLIVDDSATLSIYNMRSKIYRMVRSKGIKIVFIDYLQLMEGAKGKEGSEYYGTISRTCKQIAKELKIVVVLLSQLNREVEKRGEKIPRLHDLRASGEIEQDADIVMFPVRCDRAGIDDPAKGLGPGKAIISIAKNRNGRTDNVVINVSSNAAKWWDDLDIFEGPTTPLASHYLDDIKEPDF